MRRRTVLQGALAGLVVSGCTSTPSRAPKVDPRNPFGVDPAAPLEVVGAAESVGFAAETYRKRYGQAAVQVSPIPRLGELVQPRFAAGSPPDVVLNDGPKPMPVGRLVAENKLADVSQLLKAPAWDSPDAKVQDTLLPGMLDAGKYETVPRAVNYLATVYGLWYSAALFQRTGWDVPRTWPELVALGVEMKAAGIGPFTYAGKYPHYVLETVLTLAAKTGGHEVLKRIDNLEDGAWTDESVVRAIGAIGELRRRGLIAAGSADLDHLGSQTRLLKQKAGLLPCGNWLENEMKRAVPANFGLTMIGVPPLDNSPALPRGLHVVPSAPLLVPEQAKNKVGGMEYVRAMLSKEVAAHVTAGTNQLTVVRGAADGLEISTALRSARDLLSAAGDQAISWYFADWYPKLATAAADATGRVLTGAITPTGWATELQEVANALKQDKSVTKYRRS